MEDIWKWFLRLLLTIVLMLIISILGLVAINVPGVFDTVDRFGTVAESADKAARSVAKTSERAYDALEEMDER